MPENTNSLIVCFQRISEYYIYYSKSVKLRIFLKILGGEIDRKTDLIIFSPKENELETINSLPDVVRPPTKAQLDMNFAFNPNEKRRLNEYDDLQVYLSKNNNYVVTANEKNQKIIEEVDFGLIKFDNLKVDQQTSSNIWISMLNKNLTNITAKKLDLSYFENQNYSFWMNLNQKFLFQTDHFIGYKGEKFPLLDDDKPEKALEEICLSGMQFIKKPNDVNLLKSFYLIHVFCFRRCS